MKYVKRYESYDSEDYDQWTIALYQFLKSEDVDIDIDDLEKQKWLHYYLIQFETPDGDYAIGKDDSAERSAREYVDGLIDDVGIHNPGYYLDGEAVADYFMDSEEDYIRSEPESWGLEKVMSESDDVKLNAYKEMLEESEENLESVEDKISDMETKLDDLRDRYVDEEDSDKSEKIDAKIEKLTNVIDRLNDKKDIEDEQIDMTTDIIDKMEDEDGKYWDYSEDEIESAVQERRNQIEADPEQWLNEFGYLDPVTPSNYRTAAETRREEEDRKDMIAGFMDVDQYITDIVRDDGRGVLLGRYDDIENEFDWDGETYYIYRTD